MTDFEEKDIERITYRENGDVDEVVLTGDIHIEYLQGDTYMVHAGGVAMKCQNLVIDWIDEDMGKVPERKEKQLSLEGLDAYGD